jgi:hypothetical protein
MPRLGRSYVLGVLTTIRSLNQPFGIPGDCWLASQYRHLYSPISPERNFAGGV